MPFKFEKTDDGFSLELSPDNFEFDNTEGPVLSFRSGPDRIALRLSESMMQILALQCAPYLPDLEPRIQANGAGEAYRLPARSLKNLEDRNLQCLLRECQSDVLIDFLWYMKDADLLKQIMSNLSGRAAEMLMDDLESNWLGRNPDEAPGHLVSRGQIAVLEIMKIARRLIDEGQIPDVFAKAQFLSPEEIAAQLKEAAGHV